MRESHGKVEVTVTNNSLGLAGALTVLFVALKLTGHIGWSWWWVFAPVWMSVAFVATIFLLVFIVALVSK